MTKKMDESVNVTKETMIKIDLLLLSHGDRESILKNYFNLTGEVPIDTSPFDPL